MIYGTPRVLIVLLSKGVANRASTTALISRQVPAGLVPDASLANGWAKVFRLWLMRFGSLFFVEWNEVARA